jgi:hypothetical protein
MLLYLFITHQKNIDNCYLRISEMMVSDFIIVRGGYIKDYYDESTKILNLNCNDDYKGLPEKVIKSFNYIISHKIFEKYTHICKLDDDMILLERIKELNHDYMGVVFKKAGNRKWHIGRTGNFWDNMPYSGKYVPWCGGGNGYVISIKALNKILPNHDYLDHIYEDLYIALLLDKINIYPTYYNMDNNFISPNH